MQSLHVVDLFLYVDCWIIAYIGVWIRFGLSCSYILIYCCFVWYGCNLQIRRTEISQETGNLSISTPESINERASKLKHQLSRRHCNCINYAIDGEKISISNLKVTIRNRVKGRSKFYLRVFTWVEFCLLYVD